MKKTVAIFVCIILLLSLGSVSFAMGAGEDASQNQNVSGEEESLPPTSGNPSPLRPEQSPGNNKGTSPDGPVDPQGGEDPQPQAEDEKAEEDPEGELGEDSLPKVNIPRGMPTRSAVTSWAELKAAIEAGSTLTLDLPEAIDADSLITIPEGADITLRADALGSRITRKALKTGEFVVSSGAKLTLEGALTLFHETNLNGANFVRVKSGGQLELKGQLKADAPNTEYGNQNTDRNGEFIQSFIDCSGTLTMSDGSMVSGWTQNKQADRHNVNYDPGAAIRICGEGAQFIMNGGTITGNTNTKVTNTMASSCIQILDGASFQMHGGSIIANGKDAMNGAWRDNSTLGGGVYVSAATFTMTGGIISDNEARNGGGVYLTNDAVFTMTGGSIEKNTLCTHRNSGQGGGVYVGSGCTFYMKSADANAPAAIKENTLYTDFGLYRYYQYFGGGVYVSGTFDMKDGLISGNKALTGSGNGGGGIFNDGKVTLQGGAVSGNSAFFDEEHTGYSSYGGGIFNKSGSILSASKTQFLGNTAMYGGGIYGKDAQITLTDCQIEGNAAIFGDMNDCGGGGLLLTRSTLTISNTLIQGNTSEKNGGGLYLESQDGVTVLGPGVTVSGNKAEGIGGGLYNVASGTTLQGAQITGNQAADGAGVANMAKGTFTMESGTITGNAAKSTGGGIVNSDGTFTMTGGLIYNNTAGDAGADVGNYGGGGDTIFTLPDAGDLGIAGVEKWFEDGSQDGSIPRYVGHETEVPSYESFTQNTELHFLTLGEILQVNFDKNGGDTAPNPKEIKVLKGASLGALPAAPTKTGSQFIGWNTKSDGSGNDFTDETKVQENLTVFAQWDSQGGSLAVSLTATGSGVEPGRDFQFIVTLDDKTINGVYGDMTFQDGVASFTLQAGERVVATGLPAGISYKVAQAQVPGYTITTPTNATGKIQGGEQISIAFMISKGSSGTVTPGGPGGTDPTQKPILVASTLPPTTGDSPDGSLGWSLCCLGGVCLLGALGIPAWKRRGIPRP